MIGDLLAKAVEKIICFPPAYATKKRNADAWCDGLVFCSAPWHCYVCEKLKSKIGYRSVRAGKYLHKCNASSLLRTYALYAQAGQHKMIINKHHTIFVWPIRLDVYPDVDGWHYMTKGGAN